MTPAMKADVPRSAPFWLAPDCPACGERLRLVDHDQLDGDLVWYDEWECPKCGGGIWIDEPKGGEQ